MLGCGSPGARPDELAGDEIRPLAPGLLQPLATTLKLSLQPPGAEYRWQHGGRDESQEAVAPLLWTSLRKHPSHESVCVKLECSRLWGVGGGAGARRLPWTTPCCCVHLRLLRVSTIWPVGVPRRCG